MNSKQQVLRFCLVLFGLTLAGSSAADPALERFFDGVMSAEFDTGRHVGAVVVVVQDNDILLSKGYGYADLENSVAVDGQQTLFRLASVSKLFVWMSVLREVSAGRLDLDADIGEYTDRQISVAFGQPITLRHLMTHTAGFEDRVLGMYAAGERTLGSLDEALDKLAPQQVYAPGTVVAYSNYATALAADILAKQTGQRIEDYVQGQLLAPLAMTSTSLEQPLPPNLATRAAIGYLEKDDLLTPRPFEFVRLAPAGAASASGQDMAKFMIALMDSNSTAISSTMRQTFLMPRPGAHDRLNNVTHGGFEKTLAGPRAVGHDGSIEPFHSRLVLWPEQRVGLFVAFNASHGAFSGDRVVRAFARQHGYAGVPSRVAPLAHEIRSRFDGHYVTMRRPHSTPGKAVMLLSWVNVKSREDGWLTVSRPTGTQLYGEGDDGVLRSKTGYGGLVIDSAGYLTLHEQPYVTFERASLWLQPTLQFLLVLGLMLPLAWFALSLPFAWAGSNRSTPIRGQSFFSLVLVLLAAGWVYFYWQFASKLADTDSVARGSNDDLDRLLYVPCGLGVLALLALLLAYRSWLRAYWRPGRRMLASTATLAALALLAWAVLLESSARVSARSHLDGQDRGSLLNLGNGRTRSLFF